MKKLLTNNWSLKLLSLVAAFLIWLSVVSYTNPISTYTISNIPIQFENEELIRERGMSVTVVDKPVVTINVTVDRATYSSLSAEDFRAVADYKDMYQDTQVPVAVSCMTGTVRDSEITLLTRSIEVSLEPLVEVTLPLEYEIEGEPASGYALGGIQIEPETVTVEAPESFANLVRHALVRVDVSGISEAMHTTAAVEFYDGNGTFLDMEDAKDTTTSLNGLAAVDVAVMAVQTVSITPKVQGVDQVASGYRYTGVEIQPDKLSLSGLKADMNQLTSIEVADILDVTGAKENLTFEVDIRNYLPEGVTVYGDDYMVTFVLKVEPLVQRTFTLDTAALQVNDIPDHMTYSLAQAQVEVTVSGLKEDLDQLESTGLKAAISLRGLAAGEHSVSVVAALTGNSYEQVGVSQVTVLLTDMTTSSEAETTKAENSDIGSSEAGTSAVETAEVGSGEANETQPSSREAESTGST